MTKQENSIKPKSTREKSLEWNEIVCTLRKGLKYKPTLEIIRDETKDKLSPSDSRKMYYELKRMAPGLWDLQKKSNKSKPIKKTIFKTTEADTKLFESFVKMIGMSQNKSASLLLRAFVLAAARNQISLTEIVPAAKNLKGEDLLFMNNILTRLNLSGL